MGELNAYIQKVVKTIEQDTQKELSLVREQKKETDSFARHTQELKRKYAQEPAKLKKEVDGPQKKHEIKLRKFN